MIIKDKKMIQRLKIFKNFGSKFQPPKPNLTRNLPSNIESQLERITSKKRKLKKFTERNKEKFTKNELKVIEMRFDDLTTKIKDGNLDIREFEEQRISRKLEQNFNVYDYDTRLRARLENLMLNLDEIDDNLFFPWNFNNDFKQENEMNLKTFFNYNSILAPENLDKILKKFINSLINKDYKRLREISEPGMVKRIRQNLRKMGEIDIKCENLNTAELEYDLYNVKNYFVVDIDQNRRENFFFDKCKIYKEMIDGIEIEHMIPKRLSSRPMARLITQFEINLRTDLDIKLIQNSEILRENEELKEEEKSSFHKLKFEILVAEVGYKALLNTKDENVEIESFYNLLDDAVLRIVDVDGFMKGNPLLKGL